MTEVRSFIVSGAGSGIGEAIVSKLASAEGTHRLILVGRDQKKLERVRASLPNAEKHLIVSADLRKPSELVDALAAIKLQTLNLCGVIANAGVGGENEYGANDRWDEVISTNLSGTYHFVQACLPALRFGSTPYRNIVIVSSILARLGVPKYSAYCASKAGLLGLMRSWAAEYAREKILVNAICPGWVDTDMSASGLTDMARATGSSVEAIRKAVMEHVPLRKMSEPEEIAKFVYFLTSGEQTSITGQTLDMNNGALMP